MLVVFLQRETCVRPLPASHLVATPPHPCGLQVKSTKMNRTIVVRRDYLHYIKKYQVRCVCCGCPVFSHISSRSLASAGLMPRMRGGALPSCP